MNLDWKIRVTGFFIAEPREGRIAPSIVRGAIIKESEHGYDSHDCRMYVGEQLVMNLAVSTGFTTIALEKDEIALYTETQLPVGLQSRIDEGIFLCALVTATE